MTGGGSGGSAARCSVGAAVGVGVGVWRGDEARSQGARSSPGRRHRSPPTQVGATFCLVQAVTAGQQSALMDVQRTMGCRRSGACRCPVARASWQPRHRSANRARGRSLPGFFGCPRRSGGPTGVTRTLSPRPGDRTPRHRLAVRFSRRQSRGYSAYSPDLDGGDPVRLPECVRRF